MSRKNSVRKKEVEKKFLYYGITLFATLLFIDQYTKRAISTTYLLGESHAIMPGVWFTYAQNTGALWSSFQDQNAILMWLSIIAFGALLFFYDQFSTRIEKIGYTLILAGLWGNLIDRASYGYVIDFIDLHWWPIFNIADSCICIAIIIIILEQWRKDNKLSKQHAAF